MQFKYNQSGIRTSKTVNGVETEYTYVGDMLVSQKTGNEVINFAYTAGGAPLGFTYNGTSYFYLTNIQGDIIGIYDSNGNVVVGYYYDSWGKLISITGSLADTIGIKNPLRYRGYYYDTETSLYYLQSRYYDPETGRFISRDSYLIAGNDIIQGTNMYAYCYNNPVMYVDPTGRANEDLAAAIITVVACLLYIGDYAEKNGKDINALSDFLSRTVDEDDTIYWVRDVLCLGVSVLSGTAWWLNAASEFGTASDFISILKNELPNLFDTKGNVISIIASVGTDFVIDYLNPLVSNTELITNIGKHLFVAAGDFGISYMALSIGAGVAAATNPFLGGGLAVLLLLGGGAEWDKFTEDM